MMHVPVMMSVVAYWYATTRAHFQAGLSFVERMLTHVLCCHGMALQQLLMGRVVVVWKILYTKMAKTSLCCNFGYQIFQKFVVHIENLQIIDCYVRGLLQLWNVVSI